MEGFLLARAEPAEDARELGQGSAGGEPVADLAVSTKGLFECVPCFSEACLLHRRPRPALQQRRPLRIIVACKLERFGEVALGAVGVETERPLPGQA
jgi:hypothetical protein